MTFRCVAFDTETTGLTEHDQIIQYCAMVWTDGKAGPSVSRSVMPTIECSEGAARVNGFTVEAWEKRKAVPLDESDVGAWHKFLDGAIILGSNPDFDKRMVTQECNRLGMKVPRWRHQEINTASIAMMLVAAGEIQSAGLGPVAEYIGVDTNDLHDATGDVLISIKVWEYFLDRFMIQPARMREAIERITGVSVGEVLQALE